MIRTTWRFISALPGFAVLPVLVAGSNGVAKGVARGLATGVATCSQIATYQPHRNSLPA